MERALRSPRMVPVRFLGKRNSRFRVVPQEEVIYFGSDGGLTKLYTASEQYIMDPTLNDFERRLDPAAFCRISRTTIVNLNFVKEVVSLVGGYGEVTLKNGTRLEVSRRKFKDLISVLEGAMRS